MKKRYKIRVFKCQKWSGNKYKSIGKLYNKDKIKIISVKSGWAKFNDKGKSRYTSNNYLRYYMDRLHLEDEAKAYERAYPVKVKYYKKKDKEYLLVSQKQLSR